MMVPNFHLHSNISLSGSTTHPRTEVRSATMLLGGLNLCYSCGLVFCYCLQEA